MVNCSLFIVLGVEPTILIKDRRAPFEFDTLYMTMGDIKAEWSPRWMEDYSLFNGLTYFPFVSRYFIPLFKTDYMNFACSKPSAGKGSIYCHVTPSNYEDSLSHFNG